MNAIERQMEILSAFKQGKVIYRRSKYSCDKDDWTIVDGNHIFDFHDDYCIGEPKSWQQTLNDDKDVAQALNKTINYLYKNGVVEQVSRVDDPTHRFEQLILTKDNFYKLWNIAMQYGQANEDAKPIEIIL